MILTQDEINELLSILKEVKYEKENFRFPERNESAMLEAYSEYMKKKFLIDIRTGTPRSDPRKVTYQERYIKDTILIRLDLYGPPHTNPDGATLSGNHLHIIKEGFDDRYAIEVPKEFINIDDKIDTLINFLEYCKIKNPVFTNIERSMFI